MDLGSKILSDIVVFSKYARYREDLGRRESWDEICDRSISMMVKKFPKLKKEIIENYSFCKRKEVLPSMRSLQFGGKAIEISPNRIYNCCALPINHYKAFSEVAFLLLGGSGVGWSVQFHHVEQLPEIKKPKSKRRFLIPDSISGWATSINMIFKCYLLGMSRPAFDYSEIRPKGSPIKTAGGSAPGPFPLMKCHQELERLFEQKPDRSYLTPLECHDALCFISECVFDGGSRRSAALAMFSFDDEKMAAAKVGPWWETNPQRARANNSAIILRHKITKLEFDKYWDKIKYSGSGEPGIAFSHDKEYKFNPCVTGNTLVAVADGRGHVPIKQLAEEGNDIPVFCKNNKDKLTIRYMRNPRVTGINIPIYRITLDDGNYLDVTNNHKFLLTNYKYKETKDLVPGDSLRLLTKFEASIKDIFPKANSRSQDYYWFKFGTAPNILEHRLIAGFHLNTKIPKGSVVHHKDFNARNNKPENLELMLRKDHDKYHGEKMLGDNNPMRRVKTEWSKEKWDSYRKNMSKAKSGKKNGRYCGYTNDQLRDEALYLTKKLGRRFSLEEWKLFAKERNLPQKFSKWRTKHLGGIIGLAKYAAVQLKYNYINSDPRTVRSFQRWIKAGYDCEIVGNTVKFRKNCECCGKRFLSKHRESSICSSSCISKLNWRNSYEKNINAITISHTARKKLVKEKQLQIYSNLKFKLQRTPEKKEWVIACKKADISPEISIKSSPFRYWKNLKQEAECFNHKIISIETIGTATVYTGTVDEFHNYFVGGFEKTTKNNKRKWSYFNNLQCGEVSLGNPVGMCNLTEINAATVQNQEDLNQRAKTAAFISTIQSSFTDFYAIREIWKKTVEKDALLGVSMTGICSGKILDLDITQAAKKVVEENKRLSSIIGVNPSARMTCIKPAGTTSLVLGSTSSGIHPYYDRFYIRRMRIDKQEAIYKYLIKALPKLINDEYFNPSTRAVIEIPIKAPVTGILRRDESALELLERVKKFRNEWVLPGHKRGANTHNVSTTVYISSDKEWDEVREEVWKNRNSYGGITFLSVDNNTYVQTPFESITEQKYNELLQHLKEVDLSKVKEDSDNTNLQGEIACGGGSCEVI